MQGSFFCHAHGCPGSGEIPFGEHFVQMQVKMDFALVRFVLSAVVGTGADGIAEVVGRKSRHHGVEVNDTDAFSGSGIDEDIVDLGVIVGDAQRNFASCQLIQQDIAVLLPRMDKFDFRRDIFARPSASAARAFSKLA